MWVNNDDNRRMKIGFKGLPQQRIEKLRDELLPDDEHWHKAIHIATKKTSRWAQARAAKHIKADTGLPSRKVKQRLKMYRRGKTYRLYFGLWPISVFSLNPRQTKKGVTAKGGISIPGAFIVDNGEMRGVFTRKGKDRTPLKSEKIHYDAEALRVIQVDIEPYIQDKFFKILEHELKWQMSK